MKTSELLLSALAACFYLSGCSTQLAAQADGQEQRFSKEEFQPRGPMFWIEPDGMYKGAIPCQDCAGIEVTLIFKKDNTLEKTMRYIKKGGKTLQSKGTWVVLEGNIIKVNYGGKQLVEYYKAQAGAHLIALSSKKEQLENPGGQFNVFNKY